MSSGQYNHEFCSSFFVVFGQVFVHRVTKMSWLYYWLSKYIRRISVSIVDFDNIWAWGLINFSNHLIGWSCVNRGSMMMGNLIYLILITHVNTILFNSQTSSLTVGEVTDNAVAFAQATFVFLMLLLNPRRFS